MKNYFWMKCIGIAVMVALGIVVFGFIVMGLWNWLVPHLFSGPVITFGEALGILVLSKILFGGFHGKKGGGWKHHRCGCGHDGGHWRNKWKEKMNAKMENMSPEEKEKFRQKMYKCGWSMEDEEKVSEEKQ
ncbi:MAG: hypothetical protein ACHQF2_00045 [Flavobacteriales bacterium]